MTSIDLNADLGEGFGRWRLGDDDTLLDLITSANIACGFHAGDPSIMRAVCEKAVARDVRIGAQVGYRDLAGFGRRRIDIAAADLSAEILYQLGALQAFAMAAGGRVNYLKPHGALYNTAVSDPIQAGAIISAIVTFDRTLPVLTLPNCVLADAAEAAGLTVITEFFADRGYQADATLIPRTFDGALLHDPADIAARAVRMATGKTVHAADGSELQITADSICVHGDTPGAVEIASAVRAALLDAGLVLAPFGR